VRPGGNINYSFGWVDLYQTRQIADILPYSGTGLKINGYNFSFTAKNGNGWDDGRTDSLFAYVQFDGPQGTVLNNTANLSFQYNWTDWTLAQNFAAPYSTLDVTSVRYGFVGQDNNGWAGPYGPEIMNVSFSLNYSVDPCVSDPLFSPTCPGYLEALARLIPATDPVIETAAAVTDTTAPETAPVSTTPAQTSSESAVSEPVTVAEQKPEQSSEKKGASLSTVLSIVAREQGRIATLEQGVVSESVNQAQRESDKVTAEAEAVAQQSSSQSQEQNFMQDPSAQALDMNSAQTSISPVTSSTVSSASLAARSGPMTTSMTSGDVESATATIETSPGAVSLKSPDPTTADVPALDMAKNDTSVPLGQGIQVPVMPVAVITSVDDVIAQPQIQLDLASISDSSAMTPAPVMLPAIPAAIVESEAPKQESYKVGAVTPADDFREPKLPTMTESSTAATDRVRRPSDTNDVAGDVKIASLAVSPVGFDSYLNSMADGAFYQPKDIYPGQRTIDNARALRQLSSDRLHQEMVQQQYQK
jgi:hypothetical protein